MLHTRIKEIYALCINKCIYIYKNTTIFNIFYMKYWKIKKSGILNLKIVTNTKEAKGENNMLKFNEQKQIESVNGALALRNQINELIDGICKEGYKNICWLGIGGTYASCLQAEVHMKEKSKLSFFVH